MSQTAGEHQNNRQGCCVKYGKIWQSTTATKHNMEHRNIQLTAYLVLSFYKNITVWSQVSFVHNTLIQHANMIKIVGA